jgi:hypothetical protein
MITSVLDASFEESMNIYGADGWEMIFARRASSEYGSFSYEMILIVQNYKDYCPTRVKADKKGGKMPIERE